MLEFTLLCSVLWGLLEMFHNKELCFSLKHSQAPGMKLGMCGAPRRSSPPREHKKSPAAWAGTGCRPTYKGGPVKLHHGWPASAGAQILWFCFVFSKRSYKSGFYMPAFSMFYFIFSLFGREGQRDRERGSSAGSTPPRSPTPGSISRP